MILTAEQIYEKASKKTDSVLGQIRIINRLFRQQDDSGLWPIRGRFNVTERAIRHARLYGTMSPLEYAMFLENDTSDIVNNENNW